MSSAGHTPSGQTRPSWLGSGPLEGIRVIEVAGIGPVTFTAMLLANYGADVVRVSRPAGGRGTANTSADGLAAHRASVAIDLRDPDGREALLTLVERADVLLEGMRPGVMERLGLSPDECLARNPGLVYGRISGFGRTGPMAAMAGHDINYLALSGVLSLICDPQTGRPLPPLNLVGDYGGGAMMLAVGVLAALAGRSRTGQGQVVDTSILEGALHLLSIFYYGIAGSGGPANAPTGGSTLLTGAGPFYRAYATSDGGYMAAGAIEEPFYLELVSRLGLEAEDLPSRYDPASWPELISRFEEAFASKTRAEWEEIFAGSDACVVPVLSPAEAPSNDQNSAAGLFTADGDGMVPDAAPRFSGTPARRPTGPAPEATVAELLAGWEVDPARLEAIEPGPFIPLSPAFHGQSAIQGNASK